MTVKIALICGDGIGHDVINAALEVMEKALSHVGQPMPILDEIHAGAGYYAAEGIDIERDGEVRAGQADAIFLGAIGLPSIRHQDGTEYRLICACVIVYGLYAGVRPVKAYPNAPQRLAAPDAQKIDLVLIRESTEGLFYSAAVHGRSKFEGDQAVEETLRITRSTTEKLHRFAFRLAEKRRARGHKGTVTCVDKANVFSALAFFRKIFDEVKSEFPDTETGYQYVDAMALELIRQPWNFDVMVTENMFGDILSDLAAGLVAAWGWHLVGRSVITIGLFQPAHGSAPDIMGQDKANPLATILSAALMLDYLADQTGIAAYADAGQIIETAVTKALRQSIAPYGIWR